MVDKPNEPKTTENKLTLTFQSQVDIQITLHCKNNVVQNKCITIFLDYITLTSASRSALSFPVYLSNSGLNVNQAKESLYELKYSQIASHVNEI